MSNPHHRALVKLIKGCSHRHNLYEVFQDFVELASLAVANSVDLAQAPKREERYLQIIGKYDQEERRCFPQMLAEVVVAMEAGPCDVLGSIFGELELGNARTGQFFTPFELCRLMACMTVGDGQEMRALIAERGYVTANEPACGAGAQILALVEAMQQAGINYQQHLHVTAVDVDARAVHMAYLQLSLTHVPAIIIHGNTLTLEEHEHWKTPAHILGLWDRKLRRGYALGSQMDIGEIVEVVAPAAVAVPEIAAPAGRAQLTLFGEAA